MKAIIKVIFSDWQTRNSTVERIEKLLKGTLELNDVDLLKIYDVSNSVKTQAVITIEDKKADKWAKWAEWALRKDKKIINIDIC